jgi:hypothetical protein
LGKTEGILIPCLCYVIAQDPGPAVYFLPIQEKCKEVEAAKIEPILSACKAVQEKKTKNLTTIRLCGSLHFNDLLDRLGWIALTGDNPVNPLPLQRRNG